MRRKASECIPSLERNTVGADGAAAVVVIAQVRNRFLFQTYPCPQGISHQSMKLSILLGALLLSASPAVAQAPGREMPEKFRGDNWVVVSEYKNPVQKKQYQMSLLDKSSIKNISGSKWKFDIAYLQWDTYANPNEYAFTYNSIASDQWVDCNKGMYAMEGATSGSIDSAYYYSRSGVWLDKYAFESGIQFSNDDVDEKFRLINNGWTRIFNLICGANFKTI